VFKFDNQFLTCFHDRVYTKPNIWRGFAGGLILHSTILIGPGFEVLQKLPKELPNTKLPNMYFILVIEMIELQCILPKF
jgi:hypothetical protein